MNRPHIHTHFALFVAVTVWALIAAPHANAQRPPASVRVAPVQARDIAEHRMVTGELVASQRSRVASREAGLLLDLLVRDGQIVKRDEILARLDTRRLELQRLELEADALVNDATIREREAQHDQFKHDLELLEQSFNRGGANPRELRDAQTAIAVALARLEQATQQGVVLDARIDLIKIRIADAEIRAPFDGVVINKISQTGEWVGEGDAVVEMLSTGMIEAWIKVPERYLRSVRGTRTVQLQIAGDEQTTFESASLRVVPDVDPKMHSFFLVARLSDDTGALAPGMSVRSWIPTDQSQRRLLVHRDALLRNDVGPYVFVARANGDSGSQAMAMQVRPLFPVEQYMVVEANGLNEGDLVVVEGNERLNPMTPIVPIQGDLAGVSEDRS